MDLCSKDHDEVCYEGRNCPACEVVNERDKLQTKVEDLEDQLRSAHDS